MRYCALYAMLTVDRRLAKNCCGQILIPFVARRFPNGLIAAEVFEVTDLQPIGMPFVLHHLLPSWGRQVEV